MKRESRGASAPVSHVCRALVVAVLAVANLVSGLPAHAWQGDGIDFAPYHGKYAQDARFHARARHIRRFAPAAREQARAFLGLDDPLQVTIEFRDLDARAGKGLHGETATVRRGGVPQQVITLSTEYLVTGQSSTSTLTHEMIHALLRAALGERHRTLPRWAREGLAVHGAGQLDERLEILLARCLFKGLAPETMILGLDEPHGLDDYVRDAMFFEALRQDHEVSRPGDVIHDLLGRLVAGEALPDALADICGLPFTEIAERARRHALRRLADRWDPEGTRLRAATDSLTRDPAQGLSLDDFPSDYARVFLAYRRAKALEALKRPREAALCYQEVLTTFSRFADYQDDAAFRLARALCRAGMAADAKEAVERFLVDYSYAPASLREQALKLQDELTGQGTAPEHFRVDPRSH